jgi:coiled-coil domain-containing protein 55
MPANTMLLYFRFLIYQKSRYISNLMNTASVRGKERDRIYEKKLLKDRKLEDEEYGDKPKFMTTAYKQKLIEDQKWEVEDK